MARMALSNWYLGNIEVVRLVGHDIEMVNLRFELE